MKDVLKAFAEGREDLRIRDFLVKEVRLVARQTKVEDLLKRRVGDDYEEEILSDLRLKALAMVRSGKLEDKEFVSISYLRKMIRSCIVDALNGDTKLNLINMEVLNYEDEEGKVVNFEENIAVEEDKDLKIVAEDLFCEIVSKLSEKEKKVMCYYLYKSIYSKEMPLEGISKANLYKTWERLKNKIATEMSYIPSEEEFREFVERFLSEVCEKEGYLIERSDENGN